MCMEASVGKASPVLQLTRLGTREADSGEAVALARQALHDVPLLEWGGVAARYESSSALATAATDLSVLLGEPVDDDNGAAAASSYGRSVVTEKSSALKRSASSAENVASTESA